MTRFVPILTEEGLAGAAICTIVRSGRGSRLLSRPITDCSDRRADPARSGSAAHVLGVTLCDNRRREPQDAE
jgi:hypothetical protein